jgi:osmotically inducible protein OsmC
MPSRKAEAEWNGNLIQGSGELTLGSGAFRGPYSFKSRLEEGQSATNPEELIAAAHAGCFTMALAAQLSRAGFKPTRIHTNATVTLDKDGDGFSITGIALQTTAAIPGLDDATFEKQALGSEKELPRIEGARGNRHSPEGDAVVMHLAVVPTGRRDGRRLRARGRGRPPHERGPFGKDKNPSRLVYGVASRPGRTGNHL